MKKQETLAQGHRMCPGCIIPVALRNILNATPHQVITANATGCAEICLGAYPYTAFNDPWIHSLFENPASVISGVEALYRKKKKTSQEEKEIKFLCIGGDGAMSDIGLQFLSGAIERGTDAVFVCFDNEGFMNTGNQRSSATPIYSSTSTSPYGKSQKRKPLAEIIIAHDIPYVAQCSPSHIFDLQKKAKKAFETKGPAFLNVLVTCPTNWKTPPEKGLDILKDAVDTNFWPLFEVENGKWKLNIKPKDRKPIETFLKGQKRFAHLFKNEQKARITEIQANIDKNFERLLKLETCFGE
ncbi:MAG: thiamine pyrophosphate-dependent enzyme [Candidatus Gracilibacteria bacterium]|jgi:pyruvate ferredoxin oxidoreductase beta subunit|nr:thiamine pyrophosphate-dependent enzyme [Candidatus Gracilibacteria bacterium]